MVLQKRLDYGFNGYQVPPTPRATRSARKRSICRSKSDGNKMCAFDVLATVAGNLLLDGDNSNSSTDTSNKNEQPASLKDSFKVEENNMDKPLTAKLGDQGICFVTELVKQSPVVNTCPKEPPHAKGDACSGPASVITTSECSVKVGSPEQVVGDGSKVLLGSFTRIAGGELSVSKVSASCKFEGESKTKFKTKSSINGNMSVRNIVDKSNSDCLVTGSRNLSALVNSDLSENFPLGRDHNSSGSFPLNREDAKLGTRDDDEKSGRAQPSAANEAFRPCYEDRRITKRMASDGWKANPNMKDYEDFDADVHMRHVFLNKKNCNKHQRSLRDYPIKKRKLYNCSSISDPDEGPNSGLCGSPWKGSCGDSSASVGTLPGVTGPSTSTAVDRASLQTRDSDVKLKIKSFWVPELFIEIPETATVGSLKRTVMEAVTAVLGGGLHVGVLVQGKKIRDDDRTLLQIGISHNKKQDALVFMLEPNASSAPLSMCSERHPSRLPCESPKSLARYPAGPSFVRNSEQLGISDMVTDVPGSNFSNFVDSDHDSAPSPPDMSQEKSVADSRALIAVPSNNAEALSMVPMRKPKRSESAQRRIRRPFSVSEVEALVQAVEKLGTGRWRDVKLRAFDNARHRTYVDLKDKWKTLVHTARISPQQRRGEPVPQELLDRVLMAHSYWNQQQTKQQLKQHSEACLLR